MGGKLTKSKQREASLKHNYGISIEHYEFLLSEQNNSCAICGEKETIKFRGKLKNLCVDHCHSSGKIRGLLCSSCNRGIGLLKDDPNLLRKAINYLER
ncbi:TPA: endonuclease VII domain-containing protein [Klebsiella aerogenes]|nr:endonuclease VII domain-containing protein [Klebsiella aerogenes]